MTAAAFFGLPMALRVIVLSTEIFGIIANAFFVFMLVRYCRGWPSSKVLLASYHTAGLVFLLSRHFPLLLSSARGGAAMTPAQCAAPAFFMQLTSVFQLLCMAVMAHYRWKVVQAATNTTPEPSAKRYVCCLTAFVVTAVAIIQIVAAAIHVPIIWTGMLCVRTYVGWSLLFQLSFFCTAPYLIYCYRKIITTVRDFAKDGGAEFVRLVYTLTVFYYVTYLPFQTLFFIRYLSQSSVQTPYLALQISAWLFETHAIFSPVVSIMMIKRYRSMAYALLSNSSQAIGTFSDYDERSVTANSRVNSHHKKTRSITVTVPESPRSASTTAPEHVVRLPSTTPPEPVEESTSTTHPTPVEN